MENLAISYMKSCLVDPAKLTVIGERLLPEIARLREARGDTYQTPYSAINLPTDAERRKSIEQHVDAIRTLNPTTLVIVGIGGSNLGARAVHEAIYGVGSNELNPPVKIYFADTVDADAISRIIAIVEQEAASGGTVVFNLISKSGRTTETIANFEILLEALRPYETPATLKQRVIVTTDEGSGLWDIAGQEGYRRLAMPKQVGGRYSIFSAVGLFPLALCGIDSAELCAGAAAMVEQCLQEDIFANPAALRAAILYEHYICGANIHDTFLFSVDLESVGKWYRQLLGESVGKACNKQGQEVHIGITPTVSIGSTDLHSVGQLYLGGPYDKFTTFVGIGAYQNSPVVPEMSVYDQLVSNIQGRKLSGIMDAIFDGVQYAYRKGERPFVSIQLPEKSPWYLGQLLQLYMIEVIYVAYLLDVDPFDQPQVELYKGETRELLAHE